MEKKRYRFILKLLLMKGVAFLLLPNKLNVLVIGLGKMGTTVISKTIENSIPESKYYLEPKSEFFYSNLNNIANNNALVVKILYDHYLNNKEDLSKILNNETIKFQKIIMINRDPRDRFISLMLYWIYNYIMFEKNINNNRINEWIKVIKEKEESPTNLSAITVAEKFSNIFEWDVLNYCIETYREYNKLLITNQYNDNTKILKYEDFMNGNIKELVNFIGGPLTSKRDVGDLSRTKRTQNTNNWKHFFLEEDNEFFIKNLTKEMRISGYNDLTLNPVKKLDPAFMSLYIINLVNEAKKYKR